jgi:type II secretory pathway pseudopilin PulG
MLRNEITGNEQAFAIVEPLIAIGLLAIVASSTLFALSSSNRYVASQRYVSNAKALCQERIDEALTRPFTSTNIPSFLGTTYPPSTTETKTASETVPIYTMATATATDPAGPKLVTGTRETWTKWVSASGADFARVRVRVEFWVNGRGLNNKLQTQTGALPFVYEMTTLRAPD